MLIAGLILYPILENSSVILFCEEEEGSFKRITYSLIVNAFINIVIGLCGIIFLIIFYDPLGRISIQRKEMESEEFEQIYKSANLTQWENRLSRVRTQMQLSIANITLY